MIKLKDLLFEDKMPRGLSMGKLQVFSPGTGGHERGSLKLQPGKFPTGKLRVGNFMACVNKPNGAFWTSSYKSKFRGSDWTDWKKKEMKHWHSGIGAVFEVQSGVKIARVANFKQYDKFVKKYPNDTSMMGCSNGDRYLNWHALSKDYDGFHLASSRGFGPYGIDGWDAESVAWFNMKKLKFVGTIKV